MKDRPQRLRSRGAGIRGYGPRGAGACGCRRRGRPDDHRQPDAEHALGTLGIDRCRDRTVPRRQRASDLGRDRCPEGFAASAKSVKQLCSNKGSCPAASKIGFGQAQATGSEGILSIPVTAPITLYLGKPSQNGDIASVVFSISADILGQTHTGSAVGRLFVPSAGGLEILFSSLPKVTVPAGATVTLNSLSLSVKASRTATKKVGKGKHKHKHKVHYSLIANPPQCTGGHWSGHIMVTFPSGAPIMQTLAAGCKA